MTTVITLDTLLRIASFDSIIDRRGREPGHAPDGLYVAVGSRIEVVASNGYIAARTFLPVLTPGIDWSGVLNADDVVAASSAFLTRSPLDETETKIRLDLPAAAVGAAIVRAELLPPPPSNVASLFPDDGPVPDPDEPTATYDVRIWTRAEYPTIVREAFERDYRPSAAAVAFDSGLLVRLVKSAPPSLLMQQSFGPGRPIRYEPAPDSDSSEPWVGLLTAMRT